MVQLMPLHPKTYMIPYSGEKTIQLLLQFQVEKLKKQELCEYFFGRMENE